MLGRNIKFIDTDREGKGIDVLFTDGDECEGFPSQHYEAEIRFRCIVGQSNVADEFSAEKLEYVGVEENCRHVFAWHTNLACPVCHIN